MTSQVNQIRVRVPQIQDLSAAIRIYYERVELGSKDIIAIFGCSKSTAVKLKKAAKQKMLENGTPSWNAKNVNTEDAFASWGLDIQNLEARWTRLRRLKLVREEATA